MSEANRVAIRFCEETVFGVTPTNAADWQDIRYTSASLTGSPTTAISNTLRSDRQIEDLVKVGSTVQGEITMELPTVREDFLRLVEAAMMDTWTTNAVVVGLTSRSFTIEEEFEDHGTPLFITYTGMRVSTMTFNVAYGSISTVSFGFVGAKTATDTTTAVGTTPTAPTVSSAVVSGGVGTSLILIDTGAVAGIVTKSMTFTVNNGHRAITALSNDGFVKDQAAGRATISGTVETYFDNVNLYDKLQDNVAVEWFISVKAGDDSLNIVFGAMKFNDGTPAISGIDTDVMLPLNFTATAFGGADQLSITQA